MNNILLIYVTYPTINSAENTVKLLLNNNLIICANMLETKSMYLWDNKINNESEIIVLVKTLEQNREKALKEIQNNHPYEIPCILFAHAEADAKFYSYTEKRLINNKSKSDN